MARSTALAVAAAVSALAGTAGAVTFVSAPYNGPLAAGEAVVVDFDNAPAAGFVLSGNAVARTGFSSGQWAAPATGPGTHELTRYMAVRSGESFVMNTPLLSSLSVHVGSIDAFNKITFRFVGGATQSFTGAALTATPNGDQGAAATNRRYYFDFGSQRVDQVTFTSTGNSFEFDNIATAAAVPEPSTWAMMILGLGGMGAALRRRRNFVFA